MSNRKQRVRLFEEQGGKCWWCDCPMMELGESVVGHWRNPPANMATLDHVYGKFDRRRHEPHRGERRKVVACYACNQRRRDEPRLGINAG